MAFCDLAAATAFNEKTSVLYIFGSVFSICGSANEQPIVYSWEQVRQVEVLKREIKINAGTNTYVISTKMFTSEEELLRAITIIENKQSVYGFTYRHERRIFPLKSVYRECSPGKEVYIGEGILDENEIASAFITLLNFRLVKLLWLVALLIALIVLGILHMTIGVSQENVLYFIPISLVSGGIVALLIYIITHLIAKAKVRRMCSADVAARQIISFVISRAGFAACESCVYQGRDLIPWSEMDYFVESDKMFILYKNSAPAAYIPKKAFEKKQIGSIADIIALHLEQR